jgi:hypothetical protein
VLHEKEFERVGASNTNNVGARDRREGSGEEPADRDLVISGLLPRM